MSTEDLVLKNRGKFVADVAVIGAGIAGTAAAWRCASRGMAVTLFEQFELGHNQGSSHGSSRIFRLAYDEPDYVRLAQDTLPLWREAERELGAELIRRTGALDIGPPSSLEPVARALRQEGAEYEFLSSAQADYHHGFLKPDTEDEVLFQPDGGVIHADVATRGFLELAQRHGGMIEARTRVLRLDIGRNGVVLDTTKGEYRANRVVVAAAGWSNLLLAPLGLTVPITVTREHILYYSPLDDPVIPFIWHLPGDTPEFYGLPDGDEIKLGEHAAGPVVDSDSAREIDERRLERVRYLARRYLPGLAPEPRRADTCLYAATPDDDFILDRAGPIVLACGFGGHGFKFGPMAGDLTADLVEGREIPLASRFARSRVMSPSSAR